jgi:general secretion pathway protein E
MAGKNFPIPHLGPPPDEWSGLNAWLYSLLAGEKLLDEAALARAQAAAGESERLDRVALRLGLIAEEKLGRALANALGLTFAKPIDFPLSPLMEDELGPDFQRRHKVLVATDGQPIRLLTTDPLETAPAKMISFLRDSPVELIVTTQVALEKHSAAIWSTSTQSETRIQSSFSALDAQMLRDLASEAPVIRYVNACITDAVRRKASDIHIETEERAAVIRLRLDGTLHKTDRIPLDRAAAAISRIKVLARLDIAERRLPQDGRMTVTVDGSEIDLRVSIIPVQGGEAAVLRILDRRAMQLDLDAIGFTPLIAKKLRHALSRPHGILLVTGPTGSGKTTTLYSALGQLNDGARKILTVEDPVEYRLDGVNQLQVQPEIGLTFASALRAFLRQDPDIMLVGELRDRETAEIAIRAALTGHLVLSTLHTNDAISSITRLLDMQVEPFLVASTLIGVLAQRLVRKNCSNCRGGGCPTCAGTGYAGRIAIAEYLEATDPIGRLITTNAGEAALLAQARKDGFKSMEEYGMSLAAKGITSEMEIRRVTKA